MARFRTACFVVFVLSSLFWAVVCFTDRAKAGSDEGSAKKYEVEKVKDIAYYDGDDADQKRHRLDLYLPKDKKDFPVVIFVHGGAWTIGSKDVPWHAGVAEFFASHGIGAVSINYRLSPAVKHPEHIKDVARAFAWTKKNIKKYGGRPEEIFVAGHSAGGHLTALLATDESYLKAEGCSLKDIKGAIPVSGVYDIPPKMFSSVFGDDMDEIRKASPVNRVVEGLPPYLIIYGDKDFPGCEKMSENFCKALKDKKDVAETLKIDGRDHLSILFRCSKEGDPCGKAMLDFIKEHTKN
jgi:acetyl esterase/lipase